MRGAYQQSRWQRLLGWPAACLMLLAGTGASILLTQGTGTCTYSFEPAAAAFDDNDYTNRTATLRVVQVGQYPSGYPPTCAVVVRSTVAWITIVNVGSLSQSGTATITYSVARNLTSQTRRGTITAGSTEPGYAGFQGAILTVDQGPSRPSITTQTLPAATVGQNYSQTLAARYGAAPYTWGLNSGRLPPGITLSASGVLSGRPTTAEQYTFTVQAADTAGQRGFQNYTLTVNAGTTPLAITTSALPNGTVGTAYPSTALAASGGTPPYRWAVTSGELPGGLSLNNTTGVIGGTPSVADSFTFTVTVADNANGASNRSLTIQISLPGAPTMTMSGLAANFVPRAQAPITIGLSRSYPANVTGTLTMSFAADAVNAPSGNTDALFSNNQRTIGFTIPAESTSTSVNMQTGTVAGTITLAVSGLQAGGAAIAAPAPLTGRMARATPTIMNACTGAAGQGFFVQVTGFATSREVTRANFQFNAASGVTLEGSQQSLGNAEALFNEWFRKTESFGVGGQFKLRVDFAVDNGSFASIGGGSATLANNAGNPVTANFTACP